MTTLDTLAQQLTTASSENGVAYDVHPIPGETDVLQVAVDGREEIPIYVSTAADEILCMAYLFTTDEVENGKKADLNEALLSMNIPVPLSAFATVDNYYVIFGALSAQSDTETIAHEIKTLSDNSIDAIETLKDYLK